MHDTGLSLPAGFVLSDAFRFRPNFDVVLETGENAVVYRDGETGAWFTQRA